MSVASPPPSMAGILERQESRESAARSYARSFPIVPTRANGMDIEGLDGRHYLDCLSGAGTLALGHNHPVVVEAIRKVLDSGAPLHILDMATREKDDFTTALYAALPPDFARDSRVHFCGPTGADAVEAAIKLAQTATGRRTILTFTGGYHGMTAGAQALTGNIAPKRRVGGVASEVVRLPYPHRYRCPFGVGGAASEQLSADYIERLLDDPCGGVTAPAAMILEVVQGEGGVIPAGADWMRRMRRITEERGIVLIIDEVQTGVGRTGTFWAVEHSGIVADMMVLSKAIGGSLPLAVLAYRNEYDSWAPGAHTGTFRGNTLAMAAGAATLRYIQDEGLAHRAARLGHSALDRLRAIGDDHPHIGDVRGRGLMMGVEFVDADATPDATGALPPAPGLAAAVRAECLERGLIAELGGRHDAVLRLLPPLTISDAQLDDVLDRLTDAVTAATGRHQKVPA